MKLSALALGLVAGWLLVAPASAQQAPSLNGTALPGYDAPQGGLLAEIKGRGKLVNGVEAQNPPFEYVENGEIVGYDIDLSRRFAQSLGVDLDVVDTAWSGVIPSLYTAKFDMIWSAMTITEPRKQAVAFSQPYASDQVEYIVRAKDDRIKTPADLAGKTLGTQLNSAAELQAKEMVAKEGLNVDMRAFDSFNAAYLDLANGNLDIVTSTQLNDRALFAKTPNVYKVALRFPVYNLVGVATRKQDPDLTAAVAKFLTQAKASGELATLQKKWFGYAMDLPN